MTLSGARPNLVAIAGIDGTQLVASLLTVVVIVSVGLYVRAHCAY
jgi:hypothetical protein